MMTDQEKLEELRKIRESLSKLYTTNLGYGDYAGYLRDMDANALMLIEHVQTAPRRFQVMVKKGRKASR